MFSADTRIDIGIGVNFGVGSRGRPAPRHPADLLIDRIRRAS